MAPVAGSGVNEATKQSLVGTANLPGAIAIGAPAGLATWLTANTVAQGAIFSTRYIYLLFATKGGFLKGDSNAVAQVGATLWCLAGSSGCPTKESIEYIAKAAEVEAFKASPERYSDTAVTKAVIDRALIGVGEHFVSLIYLLEFLPGIIITVMVRVILKG